MPEPGILSPTGIRPTTVIIYDKGELNKDFIRKIRRVDHRYFLKFKKEQPIMMLRHSLVFDGRFYGAEWMEEEDDLQTIIKIREDDGYPYDD